MIEPENHLLAALRKRGMSPWCSASVFGDSVRYIGTPATQQFYEIRRNFQT